MSKLGPNRVPLLTCRYSPYSRLSSQPEASRRVCRMVNENGQWQQKCEVATTRISRVITSSHSYGSSISHTPVRKCHNGHLHIVTGHGYYGSHQNQRYDLLHNNILLEKIEKLRREIRKKLREIQRKR